METTEVLPDDTVSEEGFLEISEDLILCQDEPMQCEEDLESNLEISFQEHFDDERDSDVGNAEDEEIEEKEDFSSPSSSHMMSPLNDEENSPCSTSPFQLQEEDSNEAINSSTEFPPSSSPTKSSPIPSSPESKAREIRKPSRFTDGEFDSSPTVDAECSTIESPEPSQFLVKEVKSKANEESDASTSEKTKCISFPAYCEPSKDKCISFDEDGNFRFKVCREHTARKNGGITSYRCDICDMLFPRSFSLRRHYERIHINPRFVKNKGKKDQEILAKLLAADKVAANVPPKDPSEDTTFFLYSCKLCSKRQSFFKTKEELRYHHQMRHNAVVQKALDLFKCESCDRSYTTMHELRRHKRSHSGERPYACQFCAKRFPTSTNARRHERTHTGDRPHICKVCNKGFIQKTDMIKHLRSIHKMKVTRTKAEIARRKDGDDLGSEHEDNQFQENIDFAAYLNLDQYEKGSLMGGIGSSEPEPTSRSIPSENKPKPASKPGLDAVNTELPSMVTETFTSSPVKLGEDGKAERNHKCPECSKMFTSSVNMRRHFRLKHERNQAMRSALPVSMVVKKFKIQDEVQTTEKSEVEKPVLLAGEHIVTDKEEKLETTEQRHCPTSIPSSPPSLSFSTPLSSTSQTTTSQIVAPPKSPLQTLASASSKPPSPCHSSPQPRSAPTISTTTSCEASTNEASSFASPLLTNSSGIQLNVSRSTSIPVKNTKPTSSLTKQKSKLGKILERLSSRKEAVSLKASEPETTQLSTNDDGPMKAPVQTKAPSKRSENMISSDTLLQSMQPHTKKIPTSRPNNPSEIAKYIKERFHRTENSEHRSSKLMMKHSKYNLMSSKKGLRLADVHKKIERKPFTVMKGGLMRTDHKFHPYQKRAYPQKYRMPSENLQYFPNPSKYYTDPPYSSDRSHALERNRKEHYGYHQAPQFPTERIQSDAERRHKVMHTSSHQQYDMRHKHAGLKPDSFLDNRFSRRMNELSERNKYLQEVERRKQPWDAYARQKPPVSSMQSGIWHAPRAEASSNIIGDCIPGPSAREVVHKSSSSADSPLDLRIPSKKPAPDYVITKSGVLDLSKKSSQNPQSRLVKSELEPTPEDPFPQNLSFRTQPRQDTSPLRSASYDKRAIYDRYGDVHNAYAPLKFHNVMFDKGRRVQGGATGGRPIKAPITNPMFRGQDTSNRAEMFAHEVRHLHPPHMFEQPRPINHGMNNMSGQSFLPIRPRFVDVKPVKPYLHSKPHAMQSENQHLMHRSAHAPHRFATPPQQPPPKRYDLSSRERHFSDESRLAAHDRRRSHESIQPKQTAQEVAMSSNDDVDDDVMARCIRKAQNELQRTHPSVASVDVRSVSVDSPRSKAMPRLFSRVSARRRSAESSDSRSLSKSLSMLPNSSRILNAEAGKLSLDSSSSRSKLTMTPGFDTNGEDSSRDDDARSVAMETGERVPQVHDQLENPEEGKNAAETIEIAKSPSQQDSKVQQPPKVLDLLPTRESIKETDLSTSGLKETNLSHKLARRSKNSQSSCDGENVRESSFDSAGGPVCHESKQLIHSKDDASDCNQFDDKKSVKLEESTEQDTPRKLRIQKIKLRAVKSQENNGTKKWKLVATPPPSDNSDPKEDFTNPPFDVLASSQEVQMISSDTNSFEEDLVLPSQPDTVNYSPEDVDEDSKSDDKSPGFKNEKSSIELDTCGVFSTDESMHSQSPKMLEPSDEADISTDSSQLFSAIEEEIKIPEIKDATVSKNLSPILKYGTMTKDSRNIAVAQSLIPTKENEEENSDAANQPMSLKEASQNVLVFPAIPMKTLQDAEPTVEPQLANDISVGRCIEIIGSQQERESAIVDTEISTVSGFTSRDSKFPVTSVPSLMDHGYAVKSLHDNEMKESEVAFEKIESEASTLKPVLPFSINDTLSTSSDVSLKTISVTHENDSTSVSPSDANALSSIAISPFTTSISNTTQQIHANVATITSSNTVRLPGSSCPETSTDLPEPSSQTPPLDAIFTQNSSLISSLVPISALDTPLSTVTPLTDHPIPARSPEAAAVLTSPSIVASPVCTVEGFSPLQTSSSVTCRSKPTLKDSSEMVTSMESLLPPIPLSFADAFSLQTDNMSSSFDDISMNATSESMSALDVATKIVTKADTLLQNAHSNFASSPILSDNTSMSILSEAVTKTSTSPAVSDRSLDLVSTSDISATTAVLSNTASSPILPFCKVEVPFESIDETTSTSLSPDLKTDLNLPSVSVASNIKLSNNPSSLPIPSTCKTSPLIASSSVSKSSRGIKRRSAMSSISADAILSTSRRSKEATDDVISKRMRTRSSLEDDAASAKRSSAKQEDNTSAKKPKKSAKVTITDIVKSSHKDALTAKDVEAKLFALGSTKPSVSGNTKSSTFSASKSSSPANNKPTATENTNNSTKDVSIKNLPARETRASKPSQQEEVKRKPGKSKRVSQPVQRRSIRQFAMSTANTKK